MFAHLHVAAVGWATMLVVGLSYRLIPMMLPARMPGGRSMALSAFLLQGGLVMLAARLSIDSDGLWLGALLMIGGVASFVAHVRWMLKRRLPRPPALPTRDWSTWQVHAALAWLVVAVATGLILAVHSGEQRLHVMWLYGASGLVGFLAQMVAAMQGRLVPLYAWYRAAARTGATPARAANALPSAAHARAIFICWMAGVPLLVWGLPHGVQFAIRGGAVMLLAGLGFGASHIACILRRVGMAGKLRDARDDDPIVAGMVSRAILDMAKAKSYLPQIASGLDARLRNVETAKAAFDKAVANAKR
jgi:hypothetical protein